MGGQCTFKNFTEAWHPSCFIPVTDLAASAQGWFWHPFCAAWDEVVVKVLWKSSEKQHWGSLLFLGAEDKFWESITELHCSCARAQLCILLFQTLPRLCFRVWLQTCFVTASLLRDHWTHCWCGFQNQTCSALLVLTPCLKSCYPSCLAVALNSGFTFPYRSMQPCCPLTDCSW